MKTFSKRLIQAGLPALAIAAMPALADNSGGCPQPEPTVVGFSNMTNFFGSLGFGGGNGCIVDDMTFAPGMVGEEIVSITVAVNHIGSADLDVVVFSDNAGNPGVELGRVSLGNIVGVQTLTADFSGQGVTIPAGNVLHIGVAWGPSAGGGVFWINSSTAPDIGSTVPLIIHFCSGSQNCVPLTTFNVGGFGHLNYTCEVEVTQPLFLSTCPTDTDGNGSTDVSDLLAVLGGWNGASPDTNGDGIVDIIDLLAVLGGWGGCPIITNDNVENAFYLCEGTTPFSTTDVGDGTVATDSDPSDIGPDCGSRSPEQDIWYRYTAPFDGTYTFSLCNAATSYDTVMAVYENTLPAEPTRSDLLACNDDSCGLQSQIEMNLLAGQSVLVEIGSWSTTTTGTGELVLTAFAAAVNDDCETALPIIPGDTVVQDYLAGDATVDVPDEVCGSPVLRPSLWYSFLGDNTTWTIDTCILASAPGAGDGTDFWMIVESGIFCGNTCSPASRNCIGGQADDDCAGLIADADPFSFCTREFSPTYIRTQAEVFHPDFESEPTRYVAFSTTTDGVQGCTAPDCGVPPPPNDNFENSISIVCGTPPFAFRTTGATTDGVCHPPCGTGNGCTVNDVWYSFSLAGSQTVTIATCNDGDASTGSCDYDSDIVLYTDPGGSTAPGEVDRVACNDDSCAGFSSFLGPIVLDPGDYVIRVGGWQIEDDGSGSGDVGQGMLAVICDPPPPGPDPEDNPTLAPSIIGDFAHFFNVDTSFTEDGPAVDQGVCNTWSAFGNNSPENDAWYLWEAVGSGTVTVSLCASSSSGGADTRLAIWPDSPNPPVDGTTVIACDDDTCGTSGFSSEVTFPVTAGTQYLIESGTWSTGQSGTIDIVITETP